MLTKLNIMLNYLSSLFNNQALIMPYMQMICLLVWRASLTDMKMICKKICVIIYLHVFNQKISS